MSAPDGLYPPTPPGIPADLARPTLRYRVHVVFVLLALFLFVFLYLALLAGAFALMVWAAWPRAAGAQAADGWANWALSLALRVGLFAVPAMLFAFLLKGLFKRGEDETDRHLEVTEAEQPELFAFLRALCREVGCPVPARVFLSPEVNAAVVFPTSILNLVVPPRKDLVVGLGLVNAANLVEFKSVLAHELGHFSQRSVRLGGYVWVVYQMIDNMVNRRDRWDDWVIRGFDAPFVSAFAAPLYALAESTRAVLKFAFRAVHRAHLSLRRQMEFNADLVAVSVAGSDAGVHLLLKGDFMQNCLERSSGDLGLAAEHGLFTRDLYFHLDRAGERLREAAGNPALGRPPELPADPTVPGQVFQPQDTTALAMWSGHPSHYDRERNAKRAYFRSPRDDRPAWLLFRDQAEVREEVTCLFYEYWLSLDPEEPLAEPGQVQAFLDEEYAAGTFDPRYQGIYDNRYLELEALPPPGGGEAPERLSAALAGLYPEELREWVADHRRRVGEWEFLNGVGAAGEFEFRGRSYLHYEAATLLEGLGAELEEDRCYLARFDGEVFTLHEGLARCLGRGEEHRRRYEVHLELQRLHRLAWEQKAQVEGMLQFLRTCGQLQWGDVCGMKEALAQTGERLAEVYLATCDLTLPPLKHVQAGKRLADLLPPPPGVPDLHASDSYTAVDVGRLAEFGRRLAAVSDRLGWVQVKSLGGILALQEDLGREWSREAESRVGTTG